MSSHLIPPDRGDMQMHDGNWISAVLRGIGDGVIVCDQAGQIVFMNAVAEELTGWSQDEALGRSSTEVFQIFDEESGKVVESPVDRVNRSGAATTLTGHTVLRQKGGNEISIDDSGAPIHDRDGALTGVVVIFRDITARRRSERNLELLSDSGRALAQPLDFQATLQNIAALCIQSFSDFCYFDLIQLDGSIQRTVRLHRDPGGQILLDQASQPQLPRTAFHHVNQALDSGQPVLIPHVTDEFLQSIALNPDHLRCIRELGFHTLLAVPVRQGKLSFGTLSFARTTNAFPFSDEDCKTAQELGHRVAATLVNTLQYRAVHDAQEQARVERERLRDLFLQAPAPILMMSGPDHVVTLANKGYVRIVRRKSADEIVGRSLRDALPELKGQGFFELLDTVYRTGIPYTGSEMTASLENTATGELEDGFFNFIYQPTRNAAGAVDGILVFAVEITEQVRARKELEDREQLLTRQTSELETVYKTAPIGLALFDPVDFRYLRLNDTQAEIVGLPAQEILGRSLTEIAPIEGLHEMFQQVADGKPIQNALLEGELPKQPGVHRYWTVNYFPVYAKDGTVQAITAASLEITAQKRAEEALIQNEKIAAVGRLASSIAHEINNPLESVTNLLYLARQSNDVKSIQERLDVADRELRRVSLIANQTLRFYRQSSRPQAIQSKALVESVLGLYQGRLVNANIAVKLGPWGQKSVVCFEGEIRQVLNNLVGNALDAMPHGGKLTIRSRAATDRATKRKGVILTIADTGSGVPDDVMTKIFEPFFTTKGINGTGLGLWVSKEIVERHKGWLRARSSHGSATHGTVFTLFLPFDVEISESQPAGAKASWAKAQRRDACRPSR
jgi:PAS domain S-box-containing protein